MVLDYSERRTVNKNRPKKQPVNFFAIIVAGAVVLSFAGGVFTGWLLFRPSRNSGSGAAVQSADKGTAVQTQTAGKPPAEQRIQEPPLTFYDTLSKGNSNAVIGSGLNVKKPVEAAPPKPASLSSAVPSQPKPTKPASQAGDEKKTAGDQAQKPSGKGYTVQVASYKERKEAEVTVARLIEKGLAAYVTESRVPEKGVWYRVRIGKHLDQQTAHDLAARAGKGALPTPE